MTAVRTLPIRVAPLPGEALDSWLEYLSHRLRTTHGEILTAVGLNRPATTAADRTHVTSVPAQAAERISASTGVPVEQITAMTLAHYPPQARVLSLGVRFPRARPRYSRFCPRCLADDDGRWQLRWRLGYSIACLTHRCLLLDACPACAKPQRDRVFPGELRAYPGRCGCRAADGSGRLAARCGADLSDATTLSLEADHPTLHTQHAIDTALHSGAVAVGVYRDHPIAVSDFLTDIKALGARDLSSAAPGALPSLIPPDLLEAYRLAHSGTRSAARPLAIITAVALTAAATILCEDEPATAAALLARLEKPIERNGASLDWPRAGWARATTEAVSALRLTARALRLTSTAQLRYRIGTPRPTMPTLDRADSLALAARVPATMWSAWAVRLRLPQLDHARLAASLPAMLLMVNSRIRAADAHQVLGSTSQWRTTTHHLRALARDPHWADIRAALIRLADYLRDTDTPIDYHRRRHLDYSTLLPEETWTAICTYLHIRTAGSERLRLMRCHLYTTISANPVDRAPWLRDTNEFRSAFFRFPVLLTPELRRALDDHATEFLCNNGIDEPLSWRPPLTLIADLTLPGADPERPPLPRFHHMVRQGHALTAIAEQLHTTPDAVRHVLTVHPAPSSQRGPTGCPAPALSDLADRLSGAQLRQLYQEQHMSLRKIAARYNTSRQVVAALARRHRIPLRPPQREPDLGEVDRDWLYREYVDHQRALPELAIEKRMSTANMARWAHRHGIPLRGRGGSSHTATLAARKAAHSAPKLLQAALTGAGGAERLARFAAASTYPTVTAAAAALGLHQGVLQSQINRLATDLGGPLLTRAQRNHPMTTTVLGRRALRSWATWVSVQETAARRATPTGKFS